jgi:hypothetical protein
MRQRKVGKVDKVNGRKARCRAKVSRGRMLVKQVRIRGLVMAW